MRTIIKFRRDSALDWATHNPVLSESEPGYESDTGKFKIGDGQTRWVNLPYFFPDRPVEGGGPSISDEALLAHINSLDPHPVYDDGPSFFLLYQNAKV